MKLKRVCIFIVLLSHTMLNSQSIDQIKNSNNYLWGEGIGRNLGQADKEALKGVFDSVSEISNVTKSVPCPLDAVQLAGTSVKSATVGS